MQKPERKREQDSCSGIPSSARKRLSSPKQLFLYLRAISLLFAQTLRKLKIRVHGGKITDICFYASHLVLSPVSALSLHYVSQDIITVLT